MFATLITTISVLSFLLVRHFRQLAAVTIGWWKRGKRVAGIPCIEGDAVDGRRDMQMALGNFDLHKTMLDLIEREGPVLQTFWRLQHVVIVNEPRLVKQVFAEAADKIPLNMMLDTTLHQRKFDGRRTAFFRSIGPSLNRFKSSVEKKNALFDRLRGVLDKHAESGSLMIPLDLFGSFALDFVYIVLFELDEDFMGENYAVFEELRHCAEFVFDNMEQSVPNWNWTTWLDALLDVEASVLSFEKLRQRKKSWEFLQNHCKNLLKKLKEKHEPLMAANDGLDGYLQSFVPVFLKYAAKNNWSEEAMVRELAVFVLAGHETTANAMSWMLFEMVRNDGVQEKCREVVNAPRDIKGNIIDAIPGIQSPDFYLRRVTEESMRLNPVVSRPMLRVSEKDIVMKLPSGQTVTIPAGTGFLVNLYALHNSEANWANPTVFDPDRFCGKSVNSGDELRFAPFSYDGRRCLGEKIAMEEMQFVLEILTEYHFAFDQEELKTRPRCALQRSSITMSPADKLHMRVTKHGTATAPCINTDN